MISVSCVLLKNNETVLRKNNCYFYSLFITLPLIRNVDDPRVLCVSNIGGLHRFRERVRKDQ